MSQILLFVFNIVVLCCVWPHQIRPCAFFYQKTTFQCIPCLHLPAFFIYEFIYEFPCFYCWIPFLSSSHLCVCEACLRSHTLLSHQQQNRGNPLTSHCIRTNYHIHEDLHALYMRSWGKQRNDTHTHIHLENKENGKAVDTHTHTQWKQALQTEEQSPVQGATSDPPGGLNRTPLTYCLFSQERGDLCQGGSSSEPGGPPTSPGSLCA